MQHIKIHTDFDITNTGVTRHFKKSLLPAKVNGRIIFTEEEWHRCRRQQTNWETVVQLISLRAQPMNVSTVATESAWTMEFDVESSGVYALVGDDLGLLKEDFNNVPLLVGLAEHNKSDEYEFIVIGENVVFETHETQKL